MVQYICVDFTLNITPYSCFKYMDTAESRIHVNV